MTATPEMNRLWTQLLEYIAEGRVIPVVGQDLSTVSVDGRDVPLYTRLAERLARRLDLDDEAPANGNPLSDVAGRHLAAGGDIEDVYVELKTLMPGPDDLPVPPALEKLAGIRPFKLFVTTTFDGLLERAVNGARFGGKERTQVLAYSPQDAKDLPGEMKDLDRPAVFHLLGRISAVPDYAVTDEDILEFVHALQSGTGRPALLFDELRRQQLLLIGCAFPDWLTRFLIRTARGKRLRESPGRTVLADGSVRDNPGLVHFLERFSKRTTVFPGTAAEFVDELHDRWAAAGGTVSPGGEAGGGGAGGDTAAAPMPDGAVFLSYASEDLDAATRIRDALEAAGVDVWFDKDDLEGGDAFERVIRRNIEKASVFLPVISSHTVTPERRFFRLEWTAAEEQARMASEMAKFIVPVVIDGTGYGEEAVPEAFRKLHWTSLPGGAATDEFVAQIKGLYREYQRVLGGDR